MRRVLVGCAFLALFVLSFAPDARAVENTVCLGCHDVSNAASSRLVDFTTPSVDYSRCRSCHWISSHPEHGTTDQCSACHASWPSRSDFYSAKYNAGAAGFFTSAASTSKSKDELHVIHMNGSWPRSVSTNPSKCVSCHGAASCNACHTEPDGHKQHPRKADGTYVYPPVTATVATGTAQGELKTDTSLSQPVTCINSSCHDKTAVGSSFVVTTQQQGAFATVPSPWSTMTNSQASGGTLVYAKTAGNTATIAVVGPATVELIGAKLNSGGKATVKLDGVVQSTIDFYSSAQVFRTVMWSGSVPSGSHTLVVTALGTKSAGYGTYILVDALKIYRSVTPTKTFRPACSACHNGDHANQDATHAASAANVASCASSTICHKGKTDLSVIHAQASVTVGEETRTACMVCHFNGPAASGDCTVCHAAKVGTHPDMTRHTSTQTCTGTCHQTRVDNASHVPLCTTCHETASSEVSSAVAAGNTDCGGCHPAANGSHIDAAGKVFVLVGATHDAAPVISNFNFNYYSGTTYREPIISWTTDRPATSYVEWGTAFNGPFSSKVGTSTLSTSHSVKLPTLATATYYIRAVSTDAGGMTVVSPQQRYECRSYSGRLNYSYYPETFYRTTNTDLLTLDLVYRSGATAQRTMEAGWESAGPLSAPPTPLSPGTSVDATRLQKTFPQTWAVFWTTGLATGDGDVNWQVSRFTVDPTSAGDISQMSLSWNGYGEGNPARPTAHTVNTYVWDFKKSAWEKFDSAEVSPTYYNPLGLYWTDSGKITDSECVRCHGNYAPTGVTMPSALVKTGRTMMWEFHGARQGTGQYSGGLKAPYARNGDTVGCATCHEPGLHGTTGPNLHKVRTSVNGVAVTYTTGTQAVNLCAACHNGTPNEIHQSCIDCHVLQAGNVGQHLYTGNSPVNFTGSDCTACHKHGQTSYAPGCHGCHNEPGVGPWTTF